MLETLKFFNFGENFIKWIKILCTNRMACVIIGKNKVGKNFNLERGNAQGDTISPFLFNICYQLLLFKIEYDLQIKRVPVNNPVPDSPLFRTGVPVSTHGNKTFTFADDCNIICNRDTSTLTRLKTILDSFKILSGLECNLEKTHVMAIGSQEMNDDDITSEGFVIKKQLTILGMNITNNLEHDIRSNAEHITRKITENITRWSRYNLSLPGRILIAKTMLYSQVNYLGSFLSFNKNILSDWEQFIHTFVSGNLNISIKRTFQSIEVGGLGLFKMNDFLMAQKMRWVISVHRDVDARWKELMNANGIQNVFRWHKSTHGHMNPVLEGLFEAVQQFKLSYAGINNNYKKLPVFGDPIFSVGMRTTRFLNLTDLNEVASEQTRQHIIKATVCNVMQNNMIKPRRTLEEEWRGTIPVTLYDTLKRVCQTANTRFVHDIPTSGVSIDTFIRDWKKGSKKFRKILSSSKNQYVSHNLVKFASNMETVITVDCAHRLNGNWFFNCYSNKLRTFLFKLHNNSLPVNTVLSHFVQGKTRNCTFCEISRNPDPEDETPYHLFYDCRTTERLQNNFYIWLLDDNNFTVRRHEFFCCGFGDRDWDIWMAVNILFKMYIWECRARYCLP
jgi:hypothetical protein